MSLTAAELRAQYTVDESELDKSVKGIPGKIKASAAALAGAGLIIGGALGAGLLSGMENERVNDQLAAQLGLTAPESARVGKLAGELYADAYGDSLGGVNDAVGAVMSSISGMADASSGELKDVTADALNFASAFQVDVTRAASSAGIILKSGLAADAEEAFDLMVSASQQVPAALREDVLDASDEYSQFFSALGYSGEQAFALLVDASAKGMYGIDKAGDALKEFTIRSTDMSASSTGAYKAIGLDAQEMANQILAGGDSAQAATQKIISGILGIEDPAQRANTALALFGTPLEDLGTSEIPDFLKSLQGANGELENVAGAADRMGQTLNDNASTNIESFKRQATQAFVNVLGGQVLPVVTSVASFLATTFGPAVKAVGGFLSSTLVPALQSTAQWIAENKTPILIVAGIIAAVFIPHLIALAAQSLLTRTAVAAMWLASKVGAIQAAAVHSAQVVAMVAGWVLMGVQSLIQGARMAAAWVLAMGPVGWVIALVVGLVALIVANWDTVVSWTKTAWDTVVGWIKGAWEWIKGAVQSGVDFVLGVISWFGQLPGKVAAWFGGVKDAALGKLGELVSWLGGLPGRILGAIGDFGSMLLNAGRQLLEGLWNGIKNAGSWLLGKIGSFFGSLLPGWVRDMLGIHSPSTVFAEMGRYLMLGMAGGIDAEAKTAVSAAERAAAAITDAMAVQAPDLSLMANTQALGSLTARGPAGTLLPATGAATSDAAAAGDGGRGALFHADSVTVIEGTPDDVARKLELGARTRGNW